MQSVEASDPLHAPASGPVALGVGASIWHLLGATTAATPWTIASGTLQSGNDALGNASGALAVAYEWTVATTATFGLTRATTLSAGNGFLDVASGTTLTVGDVISGAGALNKTNNGTLGLTAANMYGDGTTISAGPPQAGSGATMGAIVGDVTKNGTLTLNRVNALIFAGAISGTGAVNLSAGPPLRKTQSQHAIRRIRNAALLRWQGCVAPCGAWGLPGHAPWSKAYE